MQNIENSDLYFFNNMYDDKIVFEEMITDRRMNFFQSLNHQVCVQGFKRVSGKMSEFTVNKLINQTLGIPEDSYTLHIDYSIVPYYTKKRFLDKYAYNQPVSMNTIFADHNIFNHMLICQIGEYFSFGLEVAEALNGCYLIIRISRLNGMTQAYMDKLIADNVTWTVFFQNQVEVYEAFNNKYSIFSGLHDTEFYYISMENFKQISSLIEKPDTRNQWNLYCTCAINNENLTLATNASITTKDKKEYVKIPIAFANYILANCTNCRCYLMNSYRRLSSVVRQTNGEKEFSLIINYQKNPIPPSNVYIYEWDEVNQVRKKILNATGTITHPNLYTFVLELDEGEDVPEYIYIEWLEASETQCKFDNIMKELIDCYGISFYDKLINGEFSPDVCSYIPTVLTKYDFKEFMEFEKYPNIREFRLKCFVEMLQENPSRYKNLIRRLYSKMRESVRHTYIESENPEVFSREVMSTAGEIPDSDYTFHFSEPMMYFKVHLSKNITPSAIVFVNGCRVNTEYIHTVNRDSFIYIKRSYLNPVKNNVIEIEVFLYDSKIAHKTESTMRFFSTEMSTIIKDKYNFDKKLPIGYYSFVDKRTNLPLKPGEITFRYSLDETKIKPMSGEPIEFYFPHECREFFATNADEFFIDDDNTFLNVRPESIMEDIPQDSHKLLDTEYLFLVLNSSFRINDDIIVTNNNNYHKAFQPDGMKGTSLTLLKFRDKLATDRFRVYYGGKLLDDDDYDIHLPLRYNEDVIVSVHNVSAQHKRRDIIVEYLPVDEDLIYDDIPDASVYHDGLFWFTNLDFPLIPEMMRVYINGIRIVPSNIIDVGAINIFYLPDFKPGDTVKIFIPSMDKFAYVMQSSKMILNSEMMVNDEFREYMVDKAKK